jgi:hypothetical protein
MNGTSTPVPCYCGCWWRAWRLEKEALGRLLTAVIARAGAVNLLTPPSVIGDIETAGE